MVEYIENTKTCSRCRKMKGDKDPDGNIVEFTSELKQCNRCIERSRRTQEYRTKENPRLRYPAPDKCVYAFLDGKEIVYIGESVNTSDRIAEHYGRKTCKSFCLDINILERKKRFSYTILWSGDNDEYRKSQEKELIKLHQPKFNKTHKS